MRYFFVFLSIVMVWLAIIIMASAGRNSFSALTAQIVAIATTVILFILGFKRK